jgi:hypothetical protein
MRRFLLVLVLIALPGARCDGPPPDAASGATSDAPAAGGIYTIRGTLTAEGVECPALRSEAGTLFTLSGSLAGFRPGDRVCVRGRAAEMSTCQQGITLQVEWIGRDSADAPDVPARGLRP